MAAVGFRQQAPLRACSSARRQLLAPAAGRWTWRSRRTIIRAAPVDSSTTTSARTASDLTEAAAHSGAEAVLPAASAHAHRPDGAAAELVHAAAAGTPDQQAGSASHASTEPADHAKGDAPAESIVKTIVLPAVVAEEEVSTEEPEEVAKTHVVAPTVSFQTLAQSKPAQLLAAAGLLVLAGTLAVALWRTYKKSTTSQAQKRRQIDRNRLLVEELRKYFPEARDTLIPSVLRTLQSKTGFTPVEVFRKYLWYVLRERAFGAEALADLVHLKAALGLPPAEVAEALKERAQRIYDKYGTLMLNTEGMTAQGVERKATCRALFAKMLYLTECEQLLPQGSPAAEVVDLRRIFGATEDDVKAVRITNLEDLDAATLDRMVADDDADGSGRSPDGAAEQQIPPGGPPAPQKKP